MPYNESGVRQVLLALWQCLGTVIQFIIDLLKDLCCCVLFLFALAAFWRVPFWAEELKHDAGIPVVDVHMAQRRHDSRLGRQSARVPRVRDRLRRLHVSRRSTERRRNHSIAASRFRHSC
jgi:hypothetical protein